MSEFWVWWALLFIAWSGISLLYLSPREGQLAWKYRRAFAAVHWFNIAVQTLSIVLWLTIFYTGD